jgi:CotH protein/chitobiase/beta-hexosaminidase-like protein
MKNPFQNGLLAMVLAFAVSCGRSESAKEAEEGAPQVTAQIGRTKQPRSTAAGQKKQKTAPAVFSHKAGFYDAPFELTLSCEDPSAEIRYTTNGSAPSASKGTVYSKPIPVRATTVVRAAAFKPGLMVTLTAHTFIFPQEVLTQSSDGLPPAGWPYEWGQNRVDYGMDPRVVNDPRYKDSLIAGLKSLPSFSLVLPPDDLFDSARGIYANAGQDGRETERACSLELIYADGTKGFQEECGVRIRGGFSRMPMNPKHAFRFFFRKEYGEGKLKFPLFGKDGTDRFDNIDLRCAQNYSWSLAGDLRGVFLRDQFNRDLQLAMGHPAARGNFYHLYINGQYWGLYNTCERTEASFGATYLGGAKEDYDVIKPRDSAGPRGGGGASPFATDGNVQAWKRLWTAAKKGLASNEDYFRLQGKNPDGIRNPKYEVLLDPINLIDYMLVILYGGNLDAPISRFMGEQGANNWFGVRKQKGEQGFKFFVWDAEHTFLELGEDRTGPFPCGDRFDGSNPQWLWQQCLENAEFRLLVADRVQRHFFNDGVLTPKAVLARFEKRKNEIEKAIVCESARWGDAQEGGGFMAPPRIGPDGKEERGSLTKEHWAKEIERLTNDYFPKRTAVMLNQLGKMGLLPDTEPPALQKNRETVEMKAPRGKIFYTLDRSDPRLIGGQVSPKAKAYEGPIPVQPRMTVNGRTLIDGDWSPLREVDF